jgi:rhodanese-related sulfurtransferase
VSAAKILSEAGFEEVSILGGGMENWNEAGYPVERRALSSAGAKLEDG